MSNSRAKNSIRNVSFGFINKIVSLVCPFVIRTIIIKKLGSEYLGINSLFNAILNVLSLSELGFGSAIVFSMYKPIAHNKKDKINQLLNFYRKIYHIIGGIVLTIGLILVPFLGFLVKDDLPADMNLYILYFIYLFNSVLSYFLFSYKESLFNANQRSDITNLVKTLVSIGMYIIQIIILFMGGNYYQYIVLLPISTIAINVIQNKLSLKMYPDIKCEGKIDKEELESIKKRVSALIGHKIGGTILYTFDNIIISSFLGLTIVAMYGNYYYLISAILTTFTTIYSSITAVIGNSIVMETKEKNYKTFKKLSFANYWFAIWCTICYVCLAQKFMVIWMGSKFLFGFDTVILLGIFMFIQLIRKTILSYKDAAGMWQEDKFKPYIESIANLIINIILVNIIGINGVIISSIIATGLISLPWELHILFKNYFKKSEFAYVKHFALNIVNMIAIFVCTYCICNSFHFNMYLDFLFSLLVCALLPNIILLVETKRTDEFKYYYKMAIKALKRR